MQFCITLHFSTITRATIVKLAYSMHLDKMHWNQSLIFIWLGWLCNYDVIICIIKPNFVQNKVEVSVDFECQNLLKHAMNMLLVSIESYYKGLLENIWFENTSWIPIGKFWSKIEKIGKNRDFFVGDQNFKFFAILFL